MLAPAILPRTWLTQQVLLAIQEVRRIWQTRRMLQFAPVLTSFLVRSSGSGYRCKLDYRTQQAGACRLVLASIF